MAAVRIRDAALLSGNLPPAKLRSLRKWVMLHQEELMQNWNRAQAQQPLHKIKGL